MWQIRISNIKIYIVCVPTHFLYLLRVSLSETAVLIVTLVQIFVIVKQTPDGSDGLIHPSQASDCLWGENRGLPVLLLEHGLIHLIHDALVVLGGVVDVGLVVGAVDPILDIHTVVALACAPALTVTDNTDENQEDDDTESDDEDPPGEGGGQVHAARLTPHHLAEAGADLAMVAANILGSEAANEQRGVGYHIQAVLPRHPGTRIIVRGVSLEK